MAKFDYLINELEEGKSNVRFKRLLAICTECFGQPRVKGSHFIFRTPWPGNPRINLQNAKGKAKPYQVDQVIGAIRRLNEIRNDDKRYEK